MLTERRRGKERGGERVRTVFAHIHQELRHLREVRARFRVVRQVGVRVQVARGQAHKHVVIEEVEGGHHHHLPVQVVQHERLHFGDEGGRGGRGAAEGVQRRHAGDVLLLLLNLG